jgi:hypothetical protein
MELPASEVGTIRWYSRTGTHSEKDLDTAGMTTGSAWFAGETAGEGGGGLGVISGVGVSVGGASEGAGPEGAEEFDGAADGEGVVSGGAPVVGLHPTRTGFGVGLPTGEADKLAVGESVGDGGGVGVAVAVGVGVGVAVATATLTVGLLVGEGAAVKLRAAAVPTNARITTPASRTGRIVEEPGRSLASEVLTEAGPAEVPGRSLASELLTDASLIDLIVNSHLRRWQNSLIGGRSRAAARPDDYRRVGM